MNRDIKFRGICIDTKEWVYGYYIKGSKRHCIQKSLALYPIFNIIPETLGQYTGLTDKNGKKIFEGDIIHHTSILEDENYEVIFDKGAFYGKRKNVYLKDKYVYLFLKLHQHEIEVICNIYEDNLESQV